MACGQLSIRCKLRCVGVCVYVCMCVCVCERERERGCIHMYRCIYVYTYIYTYRWCCLLVLDSVTSAPQCIRQPYIHTYTHTYIHTHTHTYIYTYIHRDTLIHTNTHSVIFGAGLWPNALCMYRYVTICTDIYIGIHSYTQTHTFSIFRRWTTQGNVVT